MREKGHSRYDRVRKILLFWTLFIGLGALYGSVSMFIRPDGSLLGMENLLPYFSVLPLSSILYQDYIFPGIALLLVNGVPNLIASYLLIRKRRSGVVLGGIQGLVLMLWITIQFVIFPSNFLSTSYFIFGILEFTAGYIAYVFYSQETMTIRKEDYPGIGRRGKDLVVFFSRLGYTRKIAYEEAARIGGDTEEIRSKERTEGTLGFWWCGRWGMHRWPVEIEEAEKKAEDYETVTICTPVWVFGPSSPILSYLDQTKGKIKRLRIIVNHFQPGSASFVAKAMEKRAGMKSEYVLSITSRLGKIRKEKELKLI